MTPGNSQTAGVNRPPFSSHRDLILHICPEGFEQLTFGHGPQLSTNQERGLDFIAEQLEHLSTKLFQLAGISGEYSRFHIFQGEGELCDIVGVEYHDGKVEFSRLINFVIIREPEEIERFIKTHHEALIAEGTEYGLSEQKAKERACAILKTFERFVDDDGHAFRYHFLHGGNSAYCTFEVDLNENMSPNGILLNFGVAGEDRILEMNLGTRMVACKLLGSSLCQPRPMQENDYAAISSTAACILPWASSILR